ncbi:MAG TPA: hypothetical protein VGP05_17530, partial [Pseudonocardia sp.]|nr:hypothetical protein [Pseudonocardia sp.]
MPRGVGGSCFGAQPNIDPDRIVAWGTSFAGMHIIELAASDRRLAASIAQVPLADGTAGAAMIPPLQGLRLTTVAVLDRPGSFIGRPVRYLPNPGELPVGATEDALSGLELTTPLRRALP